MLFKRRSHYKGNEIWTEQNLIKRRLKDEDASPFGDDAED